MRCSRNKQGIALVLTLAMLVLVTILVVGLSTLLSTERRAARNNLDSQKAKLMADLGRDHAVGILRDGIEAGNAAGKFWSSQPGKITVFKSDGTVDSASPSALDNRLK